MGNSYLCSISGRIPVPSGYHGGVGAQAVSNPGAADDEVVQRAEPRDDRHRRHDHGVLIALGAFYWKHLPFVDSSTGYHADFTEAAGLTFR